MMFQRLFLSFALTAAAAASCVSCAGSPFRTPFPPTADPDAARVQALALHVVEVQVAFVALRELPDGTTKLSQGGGVGTGFVVDVRRFPDGWRSLVLTNAHVCDPRVGLPAGLTLVRHEARVQDVTGRLSRAEVIWEDVAVDACAVSVAGAVGTPVELASAEPPFGAAVERLGDDEGVYERMLMVHVSGRYTGQHVFTQHSRRLRTVVSMPVTGGASGSPVLYRGRVVAMVMSSPVPAEQVGDFIFCVTLDDLRQARTTGLRAWR